MIRLTTQKSARKVTTFFIPPHGGQTIGSSSWTFRLTAAGQIPEARLLNSKNSVELQSPRSHQSPMT
jgi:hypothetical protein